MSGVDWYKDSVTFQWTASDPALADGSAGSDAAAPGSKTFNTTGTGLSASATATDLAGNTGTGHLTGANVDASNPTVGLTCPATVMLGAPANASWSASDTGSGLATTATGTIALETATVGPKTVTAPTASDNVGHTSAPVSCEYRVVYGFAGLFAPIDRPTTMNVSKAGQAIPLKWRLTDAQGNPVLDLATATVTVNDMSCSLGSSDDLVEEVAPGDSGLKNLGDGYYQINWKTPTGYAGSCKSLNLNLGEGVARTKLASSASRSNPDTRREVGSQGEAHHLPTRIGAPMRVCGGGRAAVFPRGGRPRVPLRSGSSDSSARLSRGLADARRLPSTSAVLETA